MAGILAAGYKLLLTLHHTPATYTAQYTCNIHCTMHCTIIYDVTTLHYVGRTKLLQ